MRKPLPSAPATAFMHVGNGLNMVYVDPENAADGFVKRLIAAVATRS